MFNLTPPLILYEEFREKNIIKICRQNIHKEKVWSVFIRISYINGAFNIFATHIQFQLYWHLLPVFWWSRIIPANIFFQLCTIVRLNRMITKKLCIKLHKFFYDIFALKIDNFLIVTIRFEIKPFFKYCNVLSTVFFRGNAILYVITCNFLYSVWV